MGRLYLRRRSADRGWPTRTSRTDCIKLFGSPLVSRPFWTLVRSTDIWTGAVSSGALRGHYDRRRSVRSVGRSEDCCPGGRKPFLTVLITYGRFTLSQAAAITASCRHRSGCGRFNAVAASERSGVSQCHCIMQRDGERTSERASGQERVVGCEASEEEHPVVTVVVQPMEFGGNL